MRNYYFFHRHEDDDNPAGITVSKRPQLPAGEFDLTEWKWGPVVLWFLDDDKFTANERQEAYCKHAGKAFKR